MHKYASSSVCLFTNFAGCCKKCDGPVPPCGRDAKLPQAKARFDSDLTKVTAIASGWWTLYSLQVWKTLGKEGVRGKKIGLPLRVRLKWRSLDF